MSKTRCFRDVAVLVLALGLTACQGRDPEPKVEPKKEERSGASEEEHKKFQGVWQFTAFEQGGVKVAPEKFADAKWVFEGGKTTFKFGTTIQESNLTLDPSKDPRHIDLMVTAGPDKGSTYRGIYKFLDDELLMCFPGDTKAERPKELSGNAGPRQVLYVLKKKKA